MDWYDPLWINFFKPLNNLSSLRAISEKITHAYVKKADISDFVRYLCFSVIIIVDINYITCTEN